ncbi:glycoside hydrolase superfamily [Dipodascopsis tothii]|uniref:glycoside hydrolase superfamily n=1 Tax=Dipodascopsis tothii TaxID=44089 RepID=UPI0034CE63D6
MHALSILRALTVVLAVALPAAAAPSAGATKRWLNFGYGLGEKVRGVNLGGWLVLEPYINPSLFKQFPDYGRPVDEYHFCQRLGKDECARQLQIHWDTWFTKQDFLNMRAAGLNHVRLPVGYWAFHLLDSDPYVQGQIPYLDRALQWCREADLKVWIDLHGVPGGQNGFDNSGIRDVINWERDGHQQLTNDILGSIIDKYSCSQWNDVVVAIQPVNEPANWALDIDQIKQYYETGYARLRAQDKSDIVLAIHDAFKDVSWWNGYMPYPEYTHVILDHHAYQVFSEGECMRNIDEHVAHACVEGRNVKAASLWTVVGEWSAALTDCALWLNGVGRGARYDGTFQSRYIGSCHTRGDLNTWSAEDKVASRRFIEVQLDAYEQSLGWFFWCWKTEDAIEWDMERLIHAGLFPQPLTDRQYPNQCQF